MTDILMFYSFNDNIPRDGGNYTRAVRVYSSYIMSALESSKSGTIIQRIPAKQGVEMALKLDLDNRINLLSSIISQMQKMMTCATLSISNGLIYLLSVQLCF
jgi:hypothetical protein